MDLFFEKAKLFATEAAKMSQDLAKEAAKLSLDTAKRSIEIAAEATKKADQLKVLAGASPSPPSDEELKAYGITAELREFVNGLTIQTFQDFPAHFSDLQDGLVDGSSVADAKDVDQQDLTEWQERHALLVLKSVPEISHFRYVLCPRHMKESQFWNIYFTLVKGYITSYEEASQNLLVIRPSNDALSVPGVNNQLINSTGTSISVDDAPKAVNSVIDQHDVDAYLMGELESTDDKGSDVDGFDADFEKLVNSMGLNSDAEEGSDYLEPEVSIDKGVASSDDSFDCELIEVPDDLESQLDPS